MHNYDQIVRITENLGSLEELIEKNYSLIRKAIEQIKTGGETLQTAVVCRVNKIKYPDEVYAKLMQLKNVDFKPVEEEPEYKYN